MTKPPGKIKIMYSIAGLHHGGAERVIASLCDHIDLDLFDISVCWSRGVGAIGEELKAKGVRLVGLPEVAPDISPFMRFRALKSVCREDEIDVLHTHDLGALADAAQARLFGSRTKIVHTFHFGNYPNLARKYLLMETVFSRLADRLIAVGHEQARLIQRALRLPAGRLATVYNGVEPFAPDLEFRAPDDGGIAAGDAVVIGSISTLTKQKGLPVLLDAAALLCAERKNFRLLIVGDGPLRPELESQVNELGLSGHVHFLGWIPNAAPKMLHRFDIFCQSSLWEANSIVLLEAMSAGVPIVTTSVGESAHVIADGSSGRVVASNSARELADALAELIDSAEKRQRLGANAKARFEENYTVDTMIRSYQSIYTELAG